MLKMNEIKELIRLVDQSGLSEFELKDDSFKVTIKKGGSVAETTTGAVVSAPVVIKEVQEVQAAPSPSVQQEEKQAQAPSEGKAEIKETEQLHKIVSPMVGTFYAAPAPDVAAYVQVGDVVHEASVVCIVEAMKLMNEIEAEVKGTIVEVLVENGQLVEYGQPLFLVKAE